VSDEESRPNGEELAAVNGENNLEPEEIVIPDSLPLLAVRDVVVFPYMIITLFVGREVSIKSVDEALARDRFIFIASQTSPTEDEPDPKKIYEHGTAALIMRMLKMPDGRVKILIQGLQRGKITEYLQERPFLSVTIEKITEPPAPEISIELEARMRNVKEQLEKMVSLGRAVPPDFMMVIENINDPGRIADVVAANLNLKVENAQRILETIDPIQRLTALDEILNRELELMNVQARIQSQAKEGITKTQREYFLREQMKAIQDELGELDERGTEIEELKTKIEESNMPEEVAQEAQKQLKRLERMHQDSAEATVVRTFLDWLLDLPWSVITPDILDLKQALTVLDEDHYDLEKVKERILEYLGVRKLKQDMKGPILCFIGPPGVGKTSLGKSIARAMGRRFVRISLGGLRDEAEIRGHRRTYIGALPGKIIQGMKQAGTNNPVFMMDEVDKLGMDFRGDPSSALLEILDPEQNMSFTDHYLGVPFDLSRVLFIATANLPDPIQPTLRDRMEIITLPGYTEEEKLVIARNFLIPRQLEANGLQPEHLDIPNRTLRKVISQYTKEAGLRNLEREIAQICRKTARKVAEGEKGPFHAQPQNLGKLLGPPRFLSGDEVDGDEIGVATGLAWTESGGDIIHVEASIMKGKGELTLTGHLGEVMKESAQAALSYARSRAAEFGLNPNFFNEKDVHIHVPAGAIPKDGPSAGITMATAMVSAATRIPVRQEVAVTGEITLRGRVLGGLKEKSLAAARLHLKEIVIPELNRKDLVDIPPYVKKKLKFVPVRNVDQVIEVALADKGRGARTKPAQPRKRGPIRNVKEIERARRARNR